MNVNSLVCRLLRIVFQYFINLNRMDLSHHFFNKPCGINKSFVILLKSEINTDTQKGRNNELLKMYAQSPVGINSSRTPGMHIYCFFK